MKFGVRARAPALPMVLMVGLLFAENDIDDFEYVGDINHAVGDDISTVVIEDGDVFPQDEIYGCQHVRDIDHAVGVGVTPEDVGLDREEMISIKPSRLAGLMVCIIKESGHILLSHHQTVEVERHGICLAFSQIEMARHIPTQAVAPSRREQIAHDGHKVTVIAHILHGELYMCRRMSLYLTCDLLEGSRCSGQAPDFHLCLSDNEVDGVK